jgi:DNA polymerase-3 subunit gamma/tau
LSYQVIARKWRPQAFADLVGQDHVATTLLNALKHNRLPQALLFTGPRGTGKTSTARILAKSLRCTNSHDFVPCGECPSCQDIASGRSLDVIEIDGASNNGVDAVRELRETVGYMPSSGKYKIYIIDEVHMLSTSAFNALLKTLEEPPPHVIFIMATTEVQKIPNTILSRCQRFDFRRIPSRQIAGQLEKICKADGVSAAPEALWLIARQADGSMRDSQSLLDQVITYAGADNTKVQLTLAKAVEVLGLTDRTVLLEAVKALLSHDGAQVIAVIEKIFVAGYDPKIFAQDLLEELRNALMVRVMSDNPSRVVDLPDSEISALRELTCHLNEDDIHHLFDLALKGVNDLLRAQDARIVLEMLLLRMAQAQVTSATATAAMPATKATLNTAPVAHSGIAEPKTALEAPTPQTPMAPQPLTNPSAVRPDAGSAAPPITRSFVKPAPGKTLATAAKNTTATPSEQPSPEAPVVATAPMSMPPTAPPANDETQAPTSTDPWFRFVDRVKKSNALLGAMLENTHMVSTKAPTATAPGHLVIGVPKKVSFLFDKIKDPENIKRITTFIETYWNKKYVIDVKLDEPQMDAAPSPKVVRENHQQAKKDTLQTQVENHSLVRSAQNAFKTQIKSIKERP